MTAEEDDGFAKMHRYIEKHPLKYEMVKTGSKSSSQHPFNSPAPFFDTTEFNILAIEQLGIDLMNLYIDMKKV